MTGYYVVWHGDDGAMATAPRAGPAPAWPTLEKHLSRVTHFDINSYQLDIGITAGMP